MASTDNAWKGAQTIYTEVRALPRSALAGKPSSGEDFGGKAHFTRPSQNLTEHKTFGQRTSRSVYCCF